MAAAKAVYRGGVSSWQQEKPLERLLNAGPGAAGAQRSAVGLGGDERRYRGPGAGGRKPQGWEELLPEPSFGLGCALSQAPHSYSEEATPGSRDGSARPGGCVTGAAEVRGPESTAATLGSALGC
ncbi:hypothetical protein mRhiFer1_008988 [Rhinolophus ferrumequinum]|uniref:Uncharacterized protein n=1 Tax=Rhinolophus ferrumequinum TaxID=59479 RepID=A0A7J7TDV3_RHIFE|nr:hypothetical protein mRhiFer1_008988 [Rhinolophus ferrumequinum]